MNQDVDEIFTLYGGDDGPPCIQEYLKEDMVVNRCLGSKCLFLCYDWTLSCYPC